MDTSENGKEKKIESLFQIFGEFRGKESIGSQGELFNFT
jgi:hypothetical protein